MNQIIRQATINDPRSDRNGEKVDILIQNGLIADIATSISKVDGEEITGTDLFVTPGFTDIFSHFGDPGLEYKETLETGTAAAAAGGYTRIMAMPNTLPVVDSKGSVEYIIQKSKALAATVHPIGAITKGTEGKELAEMYDMQASGAVAFSDGLKPVQNSQIMLKALQYVKAFDGVIIQVPDEQHLSKTGLMNEGLVSTRLGLPGKPMLAETLMVARDIELLRYTGSRLHITGISTATSLELIRRAKNDGLHITCSVTPYHLFFTDEDLQDYDTHLKVNPPLRIMSDVLALREGVKDGSVDCIASHHQPHEWDSKICEFEYAKYGMEGLESCFGAVNTAMPELTNDRCAELFSLNPARIFNLSQQNIEPGEKANLTIYTKESMLFTENHLFSKGKNNAFLNKMLPRVIIKTFCN